MNSGIYRIQNIKTGKFYIGSSINLKKRKNEHFKDLRNNDHHSILLQRAYNKYGIKYFVFGVVEYCSPLECIEREQYYIDLLKPYKKNIGYNMDPTAGSSLGRVVSEETKSKLSKINTGLGNGYSDKKVYTWVHKDFGVVKCTRVELQEKYGISKSQIVGVIKGTFISAKGWCLNELKEYVAKRRKGSASYEEMKEEYLKGWTCRDLSKKYGLSRAAIRRVLRKMCVMRNRDEAVEAKKKLLNRQCDMFEQSVPA